MIVSLFEEIYVHIPTRAKERIAKGDAPAAAHQWQDSEMDMAFLETTDQQLLEFMHDFNRFLKGCGVTDPSDFFRIEDVYELRIRAQEKRKKKTQSRRTANSGYDLRTIIAFLRSRH